MERLAAEPDSLEKIMTYDETWWPLNPLGSAALTYTPCAQSCDALPYNSTGHQKLPPAVPFAGTRKMLHLHGHLSAKVFLLTHCYNKVPKRGRENKEYVPTLHAKFSVFAMTSYKNSRITVLYLFAAHV